MSDHLIAEANRHAMALPTTHPTHADIAWYVREVDQLRAEVKRLLKQVKDDNRSYGCELRDPYGTIWEQATNDHARAERAEAEAERYRLVSLRQDAELATERARLDSGQIMLTVAGERVWHCGVDLRAAIDAGIKEGEK